MGSKLLSLGDLAGYSLRSAVSPGQAGRSSFLGPPGSSPTARMVAPGWYHVLCGCSRESRGSLPPYGDGTPSRLLRGGYCGVWRRGNRTVGRKAQQGRELVPLVQPAREGAPPDPFLRHYGESPFPIKAPIIHAICPL